MSDGLVTQYAKKHYPHLFLTTDPEREFCEALIRLGGDPSKVEKPTNYGDFYKAWGYPEDWQELARTLAGQKPPRTLEFIYAQVVGVYSPRHPTLSEVHRAIDPEGSEKQAEYQRVYCERHPERRKQTQAEYYARNREIILAKRREKRRNK